jgi:hypothetical protein
MLSRLITDFFFLSSSTNVRNEKFQRWSCERHSIASIVFFFIFTVQAGGGSLSAPSIPPQFMTFLVFGVVSSLITAE